MKRMYVNLTTIAVAAMLLVPVSIHAQDEKEKTKSEKKEKEKEVETIVITKKGDSKEKIVVEINGEKVTVNGKPIEDFKENGNITVNRHKNKTFNSWTATAPGVWSQNGNGNGMLFNESQSPAMLGVVTEKTEQGVKITDITEESGAEKAGLKEEDIIVKVDDKKIQDPDELTKAIRSHKPGDKISITYLRDKKEQKTTAELGKMKGFSFGATGKMDMHMPEMDFKEFAPNVQAIPRNSLGSYYALRTGAPRLGLSIQDTEDGKGVKIIDLDDEGNAHKAGLKKDDIIVAINDKEVNTADEISKMVRESKEKPSMMVKVKRGGKTQNIEVKMPRKLKTADL